MLAEDAKPYDWELEALRSRHYSRRTDETYLPWIHRFLTFHGGTHLRELAESDVGENVTASTMRAAIRPDALAGKTQSAPWVRAGTTCRHSLQEPTIVAWDLAALCRILPLEARSP